MKKKVLEKLIDALSESDSEAEVDNIPAPENTQQEKQGSNYDKEMDIIIDSGKFDSDLNVVLDVSATNECV